MNPQQIEASPPPWLPDLLVASWTLLARHPLMLSLAIVGAGALAAAAVRWVAVFWGLRLAKRIPTDLDDQLIKLGAAVVPVGIVYFSLVLAVRALPLNVEATTIATRVLSTLLILYVIRTAFSASYLGLRMLGQFRQRYRIVEERTIPLFDLLATVLIVGVGALAFLRVWNIDPTAWIASAGLIGLGLGFAAKDTLANLLGGIFIIADAPYKVGDYVMLDTGERGEVTKVGIRSTRILTRDDFEIIIPNALMANTKVVNQSGGRFIKSRLKLRVGVAYGSDVNRLFNVLEAIPARHPNVAADPAPVLRMVGLGDSSLDFDLLVWVNHPSERGMITSELFVDIYQTLVREGFKIPFPQRDLWLREVPEELVNPRLVADADGQDVNDSALAPGRM
jgi:small-conductance mechanosensitive channel